MAVQSFKQRKANEKFAKKLEKQMGKPKPAALKKASYPIPLPLIIVLCFVLLGGGVLEILRIFF